MYETKTNSSAMVETTDCLETVGVFKSAKNFFFILAIISLIATQAIFWLGRFNVINWGSESLSVVANEGNARLDDKVLEGAESEHAKPEQVKTESKKPQESASISEDAQEAIASIDGSADSLGEKNDSGLVPKSLPSKVLRKIDWAYLKVLINAANAVVVFSVVCYVLILVFSLKVSLVGKLGGLSHISSAFLISLFAALVILPWQLSFPGVHLFGTIFTAQELHKWLSKFSDGGTFVKILCYIRFVFTFILAMWLLIWAQLRSRRWSRATLKRLGIIQ